MNRRGRAIIGWMVFSVAVGAGCKTTSPTKAQQPIAAPMQVKPETPAQDIVIKQKQSLAEILLKEAEHAFRAGSLVTPEYDNAYDRFHSVLLLDPGNGQARSGLQAILIRYSNMVRDAINANRLRRAQQLLTQIELYYPANALLMDLKHSLASAKQKVAQRALPKPVESKLAVEEIVIPREELRSKTGGVVTILQQIAERVKQTDESVMIYARNDAEGRWMYKQMKQAAGGYRVRGDIRISSKPRIVILPPI